MAAETSSLYCTLTMHILCLTYPRQSANETRTGTMLCSPASKLLAGPERSISFSQLTPIRPRLHRLRLILIPLVYYINLLVFRLPSPRLHLTAIQTLKLNQICFVPKTWRLLNSCPSSGDLCKHGLGARAA